MSTLESPSAGAVTEQELIDRAHALKPLLARNAKDADEGRRIPDENIAALREAGLFRITVPRRASAATRCRSRRSSRSRPRSARPAGRPPGSPTLTNVCGWFAGLYPDQAQQDVWGADPDARVCGVLAPQRRHAKVDGGYE